METATALDASVVVPEEERALPSRRETYAELVRRLSHQSVVKHFDAYADIDWDAAECQIDPADPRWELGVDDALGATSWYRAQPPEVRARICFQLIGPFMKSTLHLDSMP